MRFRLRALLATVVLAVAAAGCLPQGISPPDVHDQPFLVCVRAHESDTGGGYLAYNPAGPWKGAYQFTQSTWDSTAAHTGYPWLIGVDPRDATPGEQDVIAFELYLWLGASPWAGSGCY